jgi:flagellar export protein FliJ
MSKRKSSATYLKVSQIRERLRKLELAQVKAEHQDACDELIAQEVQRDAQVAYIRDQVSDEAINAASLSLMSDALIVGRQRVVEATQQVNKLNEPLDDAREALTESAKRRRVAEKFVEKRVVSERMRKERKQQREVDELAATRVTRATRASE